jgi:high affinity Mn2+ porin
LPYDWSGFYAGGHLGYAWGSSNWTAVPGISGSLDFAQPIDNFDQTGSFFGGFQGGYNYLLPNRFLIGAEADASFPSHQNLSGISIGDTSTFTSPTLGAESYSETLLSSGTVRVRVGYAPGNWLFYATGGFAWTHDQLSLTRLATGATESPSLWRLGWAAGAGVEIPIMPHWTARLEYLFTDYGRTPQLRPRDEADRVRFVSARGARWLELSVRRQSIVCGAKPDGPRQADVDHG